MDIKHTKISELLKLGQRIISLPQVKSMKYVLGVGTEGKILATIVASHAGLQLINSDNIYFFPKKLVLVIGNSADILPYENSEYLGVEIDKGIS